VEPKRGGQRPCERRGKAPGGTFSSDVREAGFRTSDRVKNKRGAERSRDYLGVVRLLDEPRILFARFEKEYLSSKGGSLVRGGRTQNEFVSDFLSDQGGRFGSYSPIGVRFRPLRSGGKIVCFL